MRGNISPDFNFNPESRGATTSKNKQKAENQIQTQLALKMEAKQIRTWTIPFITLGLILSVSCSPAPIPVLQSPIHSQPIQSNQLPNNNNQENLRSESPLVVANRGQPELKSENSNLNSNPNPNPTPNVGQFIFRHPPSANHNQNQIQSPNANSNYNGYTHSHPSTEIEYQPATNYQPARDVVALQVPPQQQQSNPFFALASNGNVELSAFFSKLFWCISLPIISLALLVYLFNFFFPNFSFGGLVSRIRGSPAARSLDLDRITRAVYEGLSSYEKWAGLDLDLKELTNSNPKEASRKKSQ